MSERKFQPDRYFKRTFFNLDNDDGKYVNRYHVHDGDIKTGIEITESGNSTQHGSNKLKITFNGQDFSLLRDAIFAYEDGLLAHSIDR